MLDGHTPTTWTASVPYTVGDVVIYNGKYYRCNKTATHSTWHSDEFDELNVYANTAWIANTTIKRLSVDSTSSSGGNCPISLQGDMLAIAFLPNSSATDCNYTLFFSSTVQQWFIRASDFSTGNAITTASVKGYVYYIKNPY